MQISKRVSPSICQNIYRQFYAKNTVKRLSGFHQRVHTSLNKKVAFTLHTEGGNQCDQKKCQMSVKVAQK